jgi:hypothetical protein
VLGADPAAAGSAIGCLLLLLLLLLLLSVQLAEGWRS